MEATNPAPEPMMRTISSEDHDVDLRHPVPDAQTLQGAYVTNIDRLEETAERMSTSGSELGDEIRRLQLEQKLADSRRSSMVASGSEYLQTTGRSRGASQSSYSNSVVDVNNNARWGGYSPGGYIASPVGSVRSQSRSWSQASASLQRQRSGKVTKLDQVIQPRFDEEEEHSDAPPVQVPILSTPNPVNHRSSVAQVYEEVVKEAQEISDAFASSRDSPLPHDENYFHDFDDNTVLPHDVPSRAPSDCSVDTFQQARHLFDDFDGTHWYPQMEEIEEEDVRAPSRLSSATPSMLLASQQPAQQPAYHPEPPPDDHMVYYPAPVPSVLNLPKRLSQMPTAAVQSKRRTQVLETFDPEVRKSVPWMSFDFEENHEERPSSGPSAPVERAERASHSFDTSHQNRQSMPAVPAQVRATMFFEHQPISQEIELQGGSAEQTLDSILDASSKAPVGAFIDHPYAPGVRGSNIFGKEKSSHKSTLSQPLPKEEKRKSRASLGALFGRRKSSGDMLSKKLQKRNSSHMSLGTELNSPKAEGPEGTTPVSADGDAVSHQDTEGAVDYVGAPDEDPFPEDGQQSAVPTTLLAELQLRKEQQRTRNRTAATAYPEGMRSTLLQLDAVAHIEKERRKKQKVHLAWEDPAIKQAADEAEIEDDDVPLGMLFQNRGPPKAGQKQVGHRQTIGLLEQKDLEDNEPLSKRRARLNGAPQQPAYRQPSPVKPLNTVAAASSSHLPRDQTEPEENEGQEGETLAERMRRLRDKKALDDALGDMNNRPVSEMFSTEMLSQFNGLDADKKDEKKDASSQAANAQGSDGEEETLGQRRARLQREAAARGDAQPSPMHARQSSNFLPIPNTGIPPPQASPVIKQTHSMADLLAAHPSSHQARKISDEKLFSTMPQGSLLQQHEIRGAKAKAQLRSTNQRSSSYAALGKPLVDVSDKGGKSKDWDTPLAMLKPGGGVSGRPTLLQQQSRHSMMPGMGMQHQRQASQPKNMGMPSPGFADGNMGMNPMAMQQQQLQMQMMQMQMAQMQMGGMNGGMNGMPMGMNNMSMGGMGMGMPMGNNMAMGGIGATGMPGQMPMQPLDYTPLEPQRRDQIDQWRQSVMPS